MNCIEQNEIIDSILNSYHHNLGKDFEQYRNHVYRVYNFAITNIIDDNDIKILSIACAFHDLGIWTHNTFDYLKPSKELAKAYCLANSLDNDAISEIEIIIEDHHKLTKIKKHKLAEVFRLADLTDLSFGLIYNSTDRKSRRAIKKAFPNKGFHLNLCRLFLKNMFVNPLSPLPMYKL